MPANQVPRCIWSTALSFFAGKPRSYGRTRRRGASGVPRYRSSRASLAPTGEPGAAVHLVYRIIVLRGQVGTPSALTALGFYSESGRVFTSEGAFNVPGFCVLRQVAGGMPNWLMNQRVKELAME